MIKNKLNSFFMGYDILEFTFSLLRLGHWGSFCGTEAVEAAGIIRPLGIAETGRAASERVGSHEGRRLRGGFIGFLATHRDNEPVNCCHPWRRCPQADSLQQGCRCSQRFRGTGVLGAEEIAPPRLALFIPAATNPRAFGWRAHSTGLALRMSRRAWCGWRW